MLSPLGFNPPSGSTEVARAVTVQTAPPATAARRWDTWPIIIPFDAGKSFTLASNEHLGIWMEVAVAPCLFTVDATEDGPGSLYGSVAGDPGGFPQPQPFEGRAMIVGLIQGQSATVTPRLDVHGFPQIGGTVVFQVLQGGSGNPTATIYFGLSNPGALLSPCRLLTDATGTLGSAVASPMGDAVVSYTFPNNPSMVHLHLYVQAFLAPSNLLSNGFRLTIGGVVP